MSGNSNVEILRGNPKKAINKLAYPIIGSLLLVMLNNIIDSVWVAGLGSDPLAAIGYITPLFMILVGFYFIDNSNIRCVLQYRNI